MDIPFHSNEAKEINKLIFETIYHASLEKSMELSKERYSIVEEKRYSKTVIDTSVYDLFNEHEKNMWRLMDDKKTTIGSYSTFEGSPLSQGIFQFDMWNVTPTSGRYDWNKLREDIKIYGVRNSLSVAPMPTASTSQILGNNECFEPFTSNLYSRRTLAGEFVIVNKYLMKELIELKLWNDEMKTQIISNNGSIQKIDNIPQHVKDKYKIVWEIPMKHIIDMAKDRGAFICQSQSLNLWIEEPNYKKLTSMHFYSWEAGLKTGIYYLRRKAKHQAQQFTIEPEKKNTNNTNNTNTNVTTINPEQEEVCEMCSA